MSHLDKTRTVPSGCRKCIVKSPEQERRVFWVRKGEWLGSEEEVTWVQKREQQGLNHKVSFPLGEWTYCRGAVYKGGRANRNRAGAEGTRGVRDCHPEASKMSLCL